MIFVGDRVTLLPHTDRWMRGDRYGVVEKTTTTARHGRISHTFHVRMDRSGDLVRVASDSLTLAD